MKWETLQLEIINFRNKMNYLSHLSLSYPNPGLLGGNYIYDLLNYSESKQINSFFHEGIQLHKWIDNFSNNSEHLKEINSYLHPVVHKYAPVASDIFVIIYYFYNGINISNLRLKNLKIQLTKY